MQLYAFKYNILYKKNVKYAIIMQNIYPKTMLMLIQNKL